MECVSPLFYFSLPQLRITSQDSGKKGFGVFYKICSFFFGTGESVLRGTSFLLFNRDKKHQKTVTIQILQQSSASVSTIWHEISGGVFRDVPYTYDRYEHSVLLACFILCYPKYLQGKIIIHKQFYSRRNAFLPYRTGSTGEKPRVLSGSEDDEK